MNVRVRMYRRYEYLEHIGLKNELQLSEVKRNRNINVSNKYSCTALQGVSWALSHFKLTVIAGQIFATSINLYRDLIATDYYTLKKYQL